MGQSSSSSSSSNNETPHTPLMHRGRQEEKARNNYNRLANCYDCWASWEKPYLIHALNLFDLKNQNQNVLEIGCGTGWVCEQICLAGNNITGLDISEGMCKVTTKRLEKSCTTDAFTILKGSAKKLPLEDRFKAQQKLSKLPRNSSKSRVMNRCQISGRPHGVYRKLKISRIALRKLGLEGKIPGMVKSSW